MDVLLCLWEDFIMAPGGLFSSLSIFLHAKQDGNPLYKVSAGFKIFLREQ